MEINSNVDNHNHVIEKEEMESRVASNAVTNHNSPARSEKKPDMKNKSLRQKSKDAGKHLPKSGKESKTVDAEGWKMRTISGIDVTSKPATVSPGGKYIFVNSSKNILIYSAASGLLVRKLNTIGPVWAVQKTDNEHEIVIAYKKKIQVWDFIQIKVIREQKISRKEIHDYDSGLESIYIPERFYQDQEIFVTVNRKQKSSLFRVNLLTESLSRIFQNIKPGTVDTGEHDNLVCAISDNKEHGFKDSSLLVYDKNLSKNISLHTDKERPYTVVRLHPERRVVAAGDSTGRVLVYSALDQPEPSKAILHWHSLAVSGLAWSEEGEVLYSGGGEGVLVKWRQEDGSQPGFVPRLGGAVTGLAGGGGVTVVQMENNKIVLVDRITDTVMSCVAGLARNTAGYPAGLSAVSSQQQLVLNGSPGHVQVYKVGGDTVTSVDITQQNFLSKELHNNPLNSQVEALAISPDGEHLATVDCLWASLSRVLLKFWRWSAQANNYSLNTQVEFPHLAGVKSLCFQPSDSEPMLLTVGCDKKAKLWQLSGSSWACVSCFTFRHRQVESGDWSSDGSVLALAFSHSATLWSSETSELRTSLSLEGDQETITSLACGRNTVARLLYVTTASKMVVWDMISLTPTWQLSLAPSTHSRVCQAPHLDLVAVIQKDEIKLVSPHSKSVVSSFSNTNCTGGATWCSHSLYFLSYDGSLVTITKDRPRLGKQKALITERSSSVVPWLQSTATAPSVQQPLTKSRTSHDIESLLTLPLHTLPNTHQLQLTLIRNRLISLPRKRRTYKMENTTLELTEAEVKLKEKIEDVYKFEPPQKESVDLKSFCKLLKKSCI